MPRSSPMTSPTSTLCLVPVKLASVADALNVYRKVPVGLICTTRFAPLLGPVKLNDPPLSSKDPAGIGKE
jgi:hypothetical protein